MLVVQANFGKELRNNFSKSSNEEELSNLTYYSYLFNIFTSIATYAIQRNRRYQKKKSRELKRLQQNSFQKPKRNCSRVFFMKIQTNSHRSHVGTVFFTQNFSNRKVCLARLVFNQIHNNFYFHKVYSQKSLKTLIKKIKRLKCRLRKCKKYSVMCNQNFS